MYGRERHLFLLVLFAIALVLIAAPSVVRSQCELLADGITGLRFSNETSYNVIFYLEGDPVVTLEPHNMSEEYAVIPGRHHLAAVAVIGDVLLPIYYEADVPPGHLCTWTVADASSSLRTRSVQIGRAHV